MDALRVKVEDVNIVEEDVLYGSYGGSRNFRAENRFNSNRNFNNSYQRRSSPQSSQSFGASGASNQSGYRKKSFNTSGERRKLRCNICESTYHLSYNCPEKKVYAAEEVEAEEGYEVVLYESNLVTEDEYKTFMVESATSAILDSGAPSNVAGVAWFDSYVEGLSDKQLDKVKYFDSNSTFRFGSGKVFKILYRAEIPAMVGSENMCLYPQMLSIQQFLCCSRREQ